MILEHEEKKSQGLSADSKVSPLEESSKTSRLMSGGYDEQQSTTLPVAPGDNYQRGKDDFAPKPGITNGDSDKGQNVLGFFGQEECADPTWNEGAEIRLQVKTHTLGTNPQSSTTIGHSWLWFNIEYSPQGGRNLIDNHIVSPLKDSTLLQQGLATPFGFYPADGWCASPVGCSEPTIGGGLSTSVASYLDVEDTRYEGKESSIEEYWITDQDFLNMDRYVENNKSRPYSIYTYNCADFAIEAAKAAGVSVSMDCGITNVCSPNEMYDSAADRSHCNNVRTEEVTRDATIVDTGDRIEQEWEAMKEEKTRILAP